MQKMFPKVVFSYGKLKGRLKVLLKKLTVRDELAGASEGLKTLVVGRDCRGIPNQFLKHLRVRSERGGDD